MAYVHIDMSIIRLQQVVSAIFRPKNTTTLKSGIIEHVGKRIHFRAEWLNDDGPCKGQWAMWVVERTKEDGSWVLGHTPFAGWVSEKDLAEIETIDLGVDENWVPVEP